MPSQHAKRPPTGWPLLQDCSGNLANKIKTSPPQPKTMGKPKLHMVWCPCNHYTHIHWMPKDTGAVGMAAQDGSDHWTCLLRLAGQPTPPTDLPNHTACKRNQLPDHDDSEEDMEFTRQNRQLKVNRLIALVRNDLKARHEMNLPDINVPL